MHRDRPDQRDQLHLRHHRHQRQRHRPRGHRGPRRRRCARSAAHPSATAGHTSASVSWTAPASDGGSAITGYTVTASPGGATCTTTGALTCTVTGLTNGTSYTFAITATNAVGTGPASAATTAVTPAPGPPTAPRTPTAVAGNARASVSWTAPASDGGSPITGYVVTASPGGASCVTSTLACAVTGLTNGTAYTFSIVATNSAGTGPASTATTAVTPAPSAPTAPRSPVATSGSRQVTVTWTAPADDGGSPITGYSVTAAPGGGTCTTTGALTCTVTGLTDGTAYTFAITATNAVGTGPSAGVAATPAAGSPGPVTGVLATARTSSIDVSWTPPTTGSPVDHYLVTASPGRATCRTSTTSCVLGGVEGVAYTVTVQAVDALGRVGQPGSASTTPVRAPQIATAPPADAPLTLTTDQGRISVVSPGQALTVLGTGFAAHSTATIAIYSTPVVLGTVVTDGNGNFAKPVVVPPELAAGTHTLVAYGVDPAGATHSMRMLVTVSKASGTGPAGSATAARGRGSSLASTGADVAAPLTGGIALTALGLGLLLVAQRRRAAAGARTSMPAARDD
nr:fibronectin type III domain-containing protein [Blastococcus sp. TF02-8]